MIGKTIVDFERIALSVNDGHLEKDDGDTLSS